MVAVDVTSQYLDHRWELMFPHSAVSAAPAVWGDIVYAAAENGDVAAVAFDLREPPAAAKFSSAARAEQNAQKATSRVARQNAGRMQGMDRGSGGWILPIRPEGTQCGGARPLKGAIGALQLNMASGPCEANQSANCQAGHMRQHLSGSKSGRRKGRDKYPPEYFEITLYLARAYDLLGRRAEASSIYESGCVSSGLGGLQYSSNCEDGWAIHGEGLSRVVMPYST